MQENNWKTEEPSSDYNIQKESTLHSVFHLRSGTMQIFVKIWLERFFGFDVEPNDTFINVKARFKTKKAFHLATKVISFPLTLVCSERKELSEKKGKIHVEKRQRLSKFYLWWYRKNSLPILGKTVQICLESGCFFVHFRFLFVWSSFSVSFNKSGFFFFVEEHHF